MQLRCMFLEIIGFVFTDTETGLIGKKGDLIEHSRHATKSPRLIMVGPTQQGH